MTVSALTLTKYSQTAQISMDNLMRLDLEVANRVVSGVNLTNVNSTINFFFEEDDYRVFFITTHSNTARQILCQVILFA